jgi:hypothetical protein
VQIFDCPQNSEAWFEARRGVPTASAFAQLLAKGEGITRKTYMLKLAGEIITGRGAKSFSNEDTERGHEWEPEARDLYAFQTGAALKRVGFIRNGRMGCSPDSLIDEDGGLEVKTTEPHLLIEIMLKDEFPPKHKAQVQGTLLVTGRQWWDLLVYSRDMPPFIKRAYRDEKYIQSLATEIDKFNAELDDVVSKIRARGERLAA